MRKARLAELIFSLVTSHDRAVSMAGDLLEETEGSGAWRFWFYVAQTAFSLLWRQISATPFPLWRAAIRALLAEFGFMVGACLVFVFLLWIGISTSTVYFHSDLPPWVNALLASVLTTLLVPFQIGGWISRRYAGREAAVGLSVATAHAVIKICAGFTCWAAARLGGELHVDVSFAEIRFIDWNGNMFAMALAMARYFTLFQAMLLVGAVWARSTVARKRSTSIPNTP